MDDFVKDKTALARSLDKASTALEQEARNLRIQAESLRRAAKHHAKIIKTLGSAPHLVNQLASEGFENPIAEAAARLGIAEDTVEWHYANFNTKVKSTSRRRRDREIVRLAKTGMTNDAIAERMKVSKSTVKRTLKASDLGRYARPVSLARRKKVRLKRPLPSTPD